MATRNLTMVVDRKHAEEHELGFAAPPIFFHDNSYVNMYLHHDGYPQYQGVQIANWLQANAIHEGSQIAAKLVHDHYYDACYLYADCSHVDVNYTYIIFAGKKDVWVSCYDNYEDKNIFVLQAPKIITKYKTDMDYTDFTNGDIRCEKTMNDSAKTILDLLQS